MMLTAMNNINLYRLGLSGWKGRKPRLMTLARAAGEAAAYRQVRARLETDLAAPSLLAEAAGWFKPPKAQARKRLLTGQGLGWRRRDGR